MARATPVLINPHAAVVEYLGEAYPLYFDNLEEAAQKAMDFKLILQAHDYLVNLPRRQQLSAESFRRQLQGSSIYQHLDAPGIPLGNWEQGRQCDVL